MSEFEPPKTYYDPYSHTQKPVLTEAQVQSMWPYARKERKDALKGNPMDDAMPNLEGPQWPLDAGIPTDNQLDFFDKLGASIDANLLTSGERLGADMVVLPQHYANFKIEPIRFLIENLGTVGFKFNIVKYAMRAEHKHPTPNEDIKKIIRYGQMWLKYVEGDPDWWKAPKDA